MGYKAPKTKLGRVSVIFELDGANHGLRYRFESFECVGGPHLERITGREVGPNVRAYVSKGANPPVYWSKRPDGSFAIVDGEVYDIDQSSDSRRDGDPSAWVLAAYEKSGPVVFERIDMSASLVLWDAAAETLYIVRDRSGIVPSFYNHVGGTFIWASDIWTVMKLSGSSEFDHAAIDFFLANGFLIAPMSLIKGIEKIPPAHTLSFTQQGRFGLERYWPRVDKQQPELNLTEWTEAMTESFGKALRRRWDSSGSDSVFLSGGMDSALVVAGLKKTLGSEVDTFTLGYENYQGRNDEREQARANAQTLGTHHHEITFGPQDIINNYESMVVAHGAPFTWGLRAFFLDPIAKAGFRAVLSGDGPDSYYSSRTNLTSKSLSVIPRPIRNALAPTLISLLRPYNPKLAGRISSVNWCVNTGLPARCAERILPYFTRRTLYDDPSLVTRGRQSAFEIMQGHDKEYSDWDFINRNVYTHLRYFAAEHTFAFNHWWASWHGIRYRVPFCDYELMDIVLSQTRTTSDKIHFRHFAAFYLPDNMVNIHKRSIAVPVSEWLHGPLREFASDLLSPNELRRMDILNVDRVRTYLTQHLNSQANHGIGLWAVLTLVVWARLVDDLRRDTAWPTVAGDVTRISVGH